MGPCEEKEARLGGRGGFLKQMLSRGMDGPVRQELPGRLSSAEAQHVKGPRAPGERLGSLHEVRSSNHRQRVHAMELRS